jgi:hypothetical protein
MPYNGFTIEELLEEFKKDMYQDFIKQLREGKKELRMEKGVE